MNETTYAWIVHSDINENTIYAEFATEEEAIDYARGHKDELTYVDKVEVALDEDGDIIEMFDSETVWVYDEDDNFFESLVEDLEENEDIVECKECFELFPKVNGIKREHGYVCPHCASHVHAVDTEPDFDISDIEVFALDFPEVTRVTATDYPEVQADCEVTDCVEPMPEIGPNPESTAEPCVGPECEAPVEAPVTKDETIIKLVVDEHEAIDGYDKAEVVIANNAEIDPEEKEEIIDTIRHIKEEEVEHIEELEELVDEVEEPEILAEHVNEEHPAIESEQELEGTDNAVVKCKITKVITHSEDEKPVNCKGEKKPLEKPLAEETHAKYAKPEGNRVQAYNNALKYAKKDNKPYIYGYSQIGDGKFFALEQPVKVTGSSMDAEKEFRNQYKRCAAVYVVYPDKGFITEALVENIEDDLIKAYNDVISTEKELQEIKQEIHKFNHTEIYDTAEYKELYNRLDSVHKEIQDLENTYGRWEIINNNWDHDWIVFDSDKEEELAPKIKELQSVAWELQQQLETFKKEKEAKLNNTLGADLKTKKELVSTTKTISQATLEKYIEAEKENILKALNYIGSEDEFKLNLKRASFNSKTNTIFVPFESFYTRELSLYDDYDFDEDGNANFEYDEDDAKEFAEDYLITPADIAEFLNLSTDEDGDYIIPGSDWILLSEADYSFKSMPEVYSYREVPASYDEPGYVDADYDDEVTVCLTCYLAKTLKVSSDSVVENFKFTTTEQLNESSIQKGDYEISPTERLSWGWDKGDTFYVEKNFRPSEKEQIWNTEFRRTYATAEDAERAFKRYVKKYSVLTEDALDWELEKVEIKEDSLEETNVDIKGECTVHGNLETFDNIKEHTEDDARFDYDKKVGEAEVKGLSSDFTESDVDEIERIVARDIRLNLKKNKN